MAQPAPARTPFSPRVAAFLGAEALSAIGSWATIVAVWGYAAYEYDATAAEVSLFGVAFSLPAILLGPLAGTVVDRIGPKATLAAGKVLGIAASLALLGADDFRTLALLSFLHGVAMTFSIPALQSLPPRLVADEHLARTNALVSLTDELAIVFGPVAAGVGIAAFGFRGAFVFDALTYAVGLVVLPMVRLLPIPDDGTEEPVRLRDTLEGWRLVLRTGVLRRVVAATFTVHLLYGAALLAEPLYVRDVLERSEATFAALQTAFGVCLVAGGLLAARAGERFATYGWIATGVGLSGLFAIVYLSTPWVGVAFTGVALWGVATAIISGPSRTVLQRATPHRAHGRVMAADLVAGGTAELAGIGIAGVLISAFDVPITIGLLGLGAATVAATLAMADRRDGAADVPVVEAFNDAINERDLEALAALMTEDHRFLDSTGTVVEGKAACTEAWRAFFDAFPDHRNVFERVESAGHGRVVVVGRSEGGEPDLDGPVRWRAELTSGRILRWQAFDDGPALVAPVDLAEAGSVG